MSSIRGLAEIVLAVHDIQASVAFYRDVLGLRVISSLDFTSPVFLQAGEGRAYIANMLALVSLPSGTLPFTKPSSLDHLAFEIGSEYFDAEVARLQSLGLEVRFGQHPLLPSRTMYITDPDDNEVELICPI